MACDDDGDPSVRSVMLKLISLWKSAGLASKPSLLMTASACVTLKHSKTSSAVSIPPLAINGTGIDAFMADIASQSAAPHFEP